jgi:hypothetical protein
MKFSFGLDPEFMLYYRNKYYSATDIISGSKNRRIHKDGHQYYYDNVMAECAIKPSYTKQETLENIQSCLKTYASMVKPYKLLPQAAYTYTSDQLLHPDAREVGCKIEWCAYAMCAIEDTKTERIIKKTNFRTAGGHIHLGAENRILQDGFMQIFTIRMLDLFLGLPLLYIDKDETAITRRKLYGQAGRHRKPVYGIEYRTPGNYWLSSPKFVELVYDICEFCLSFVENENHKQFWTVKEDYNGDDWSKSHRCHGYSVRDLRTSIDKSNLSKGLKLMGFIKEYLPQNINQAIESAKSMRFCDMYKEWNL